MPKSTNRSRYFTQVRPRVKRYPVQSEAKVKTVERFRDQSSAVAENSILKWPRRDKAVSHASNCSEMLRSRWVFLDVPSQPHDKIIDRSRVGVFVQIPDFLEYLLSGNSLSRMSNEVSQQVRLHKCKLYRSIFCSKL